MTRFELSISPTYVPDWGLVEAIRELFQNALDQQTENPENIMTYHWDIDEKCFYISSKESKLEKSSLLLGCSSKSDDASTIGKFGEGYKLALLVLTRLSYKVTIYNYAAKEIWTPKIIRSRRYNSDLLVIDVKKHIFKSVPDSNLTFKIHGITMKDFDLIKEHNLFMQKKYNKIDTSKAEILIDEEYKGMLFVSGLYITKVKHNVATKGYNFASEVIMLDRDRSLVDSFNLNWETSRIWAGESDSSICKELVIANAPDVKFIHHYVSDNTLTLSENIFDDFQSKNGLDTIPVSTQYDFVHAKKKYPSLKPIIVSNEIATIMNKSITLTDMKESLELAIKEKTIKQQINELVEKHLEDLTDSFVDELDEILENLIE